MNGFDILEGSAVNSFATDGRRTPAGSRRNIRAIRSNDKMRNLKGNGGNRREPRPMKRPKDAANRLQKIGNIKVL
ncbi:hypothetical protein BC363_30500 [Ensifer sp. LC384]|nr:hypothetical protein BC363_30500 [Ensifer sp. LC384]